VCTHTHTHTKNTTLRRVTFFAWLASILAGMPAQAGTGMGCRYEPDPRAAVSRERRPELITNAGGPCLSSPLSLLHPPPPNPNPRWVVLCQVFRSLGFQVFRSSGLQVFRSVGFQVFRSSGF